MRTLPLFVALFLGGGPAFWQGERRARFEDRRIRPPVVEQARESGPLPRIVETDQPRRPREPVRKLPGARATRTVKRAQVGDRRYAESHIVVRFSGSLAGWRQDSITAALGGAGRRPALFSDFSRVMVAPGDQAEELVERFRRNPDVRWAELDPLCHVTSGGDVRAAAGFSDPLFSRQWHHERIRLAEARDFASTDGRGVIVAVIDSGVAFGSGRSFPSRRGLDLEGTRFASGFDFVDDDGSALDLGFGIDPDDPFGSQRFGHGTFAAAVIAATANNGLAGAGVAPQVTILPIRALGIDGFGTFSDLAESINFAVARGARVINMSLGGASGSTPVRDAVQAAHAAGVVLVAAAGNEAEEPDFDGDVAFPARYPQVLAVGATAFDDDRASYSNTGPNLDLTAPGGEDVDDEVAAGTRNAVLASSFLHDPRTSETLYASFWTTGTSFSTPQVSAAAAILISLGVDDPDSVRQILTTTARDLPPTGFDQDTGSGLLDLLDAVRGFGFSF